MVEQENQKLIERLKQENETLQAKVGLLCVVIGDLQGIQEKIVEGLGLEAMEEEDETDSISTSSPEYEFSQVEQARYLLVMVGNALAGDEQRRELYYQVLGQIETLERRVSKLRSEIATDYPFGALVMTLDYYGITLDPIVEDQLVIELAKLAREAV
jgi:hypothetical protein